MIQIELSVCLDLYLELAFTPKMTLLRSETGTLKFVPTTEELPNSLDSKHKTKSEEEESRNSYQNNKYESSLSSSIETKGIESDDKNECHSPNPYSSANVSSKNLEKLKEMMNKRFSTEKPLPINSLIPTEEHRCEICKKTFKSYSGLYKHGIRCKKSLEKLLNNIKPLESILLKPGSKVDPGITDPSGNTSSNLKNESLHTDNQDNEDNWALATRTAAGTIDNPSYYFVKKFTLPKDLFSSLHADGINSSEQKESSSDILPHTSSSINVDYTKIKKPMPILPRTDGKEETGNYTCKNCKLYYKTSVGLYHHQLKCSKPLPINAFKTTETHTCKGCKISFKTRFGLYRHGPKCAKPLPIKISNKNRICSKCNKSFKSYSGLRNHLSKCGRSKKFGKKLIAVETDPMEEHPKLYSPTEIGQIIYPSNSLSASLMNDDSLNSNKETDSAIATKTTARNIVGPITFIKRNLIRPSRGTIKFQEKFVSSSPHKLCEKYSSLPPSSLETKRKKFISILKNSRDTD